MNVSHSNELTEVGELPSAFAGKAAVITGAASGIGAAMAAHAADLGMRLMLADIDAAGLDMIVDGIRSRGGHAFACVTDVADAASVQALAIQAWERLDTVDLLINNAGISTLGYAWQVSPERWQQTIGVNLLGAVNAIRAFVPGMLTSSVRARIVNFGSHAALSMAPMNSAYIASKHAVLALTETLSLEFAHLGAPIDVSIVIPGVIATGIMEASSVPDGAPVVTGHQLGLRRHVAAGMPPAEAAAKIFEGIARGDFWIMTHPHETKRVAEARGHHLARLERPFLSDELRALL